jgi:peptidoglycan L-alanyl-D-glutamate endopeptidase CwlK
MPSRNLNDLYAPLRNVIIKGLRIAKSRNVRVLVTCTWRSEGEQYALWCQGRKTLAEVNRARKLYGLSRITEKKNKVVTWVKSSYHTCWPKSMAFDFCILREDKSATWDIKADVNDNDIPDYDEFAKICKEVDPNIEWGGDWDKKDYCHVQWKNGMKIDQLTKKEKKSTLVAEAIVEKKLVKVSVWNKLKNWIKHRC